MGEVTINICKERSKGVRVTVTVCEVIDSSCEVTLAVYQRKYTI